MRAARRSRQLIAVEREKFVDGVDRMGYGRALGTRLFDIIEPFADYAFGRSHAFGYALIAYQTAYLKAHYPVEYLACLLTSVKSSLEKAAVYIAECRSLGIKVLPPDVNVSLANFTAMSPDEVADGVTLPPGFAGSDLVRTVGRAQRRRGTRRPAARRARRPTARTPASTSSPTACPSRCSTSGRSSR